jgi:glutaconate CoA-transferase subunit B
MIIMGAAAPKSPLAIPPTSKLVGILTSSNEGACIDGHRRSGIEGPLMADMEYCVEDLICTCIARQVQDGDILAQGLATPLVAAGYLLAWHTHAPNAYFASAIGQSICREGASLGIATIESLWLDHSLIHFGFVQAAADLLPRYSPKEFFRPAQVDRHGNFNNIIFGRDYQRPRLRLPGSGGIPDVTPISEAIYLYVPRHSRVTFVKELDMLSGLGHDPVRRHGNGAQYLVSDLGQFDFPNGRMRLTHLHPGVPLERVNTKTGFELEMASDLQETPPPTQEELHLLYKVIDPLGIRRLESLSGPARKEALKDMLKLEKANSGIPELE